MEKGLVWLSAAKRHSTARVGDVGQSGPLFGPTAAPPTPIDPAQLARRGFAFDFAEVALDESDYLGMPCGDVDLVLHE